MNIVKKSYNDSYLYNLEGKKHNQLLSQFIINAERIENKRSSEFIGITEDIKRLQRSNVLYTLLMRDDVVLCINNKEMPRAFKVFMAKDLREGSSSGRKVFIDLTGIVSYKDGYYVCKNSQYLVTYLFQALCYYLYEHDTTRFINNSTITLSGTEAFSAMFCYIIDYMRLIGYEQNKMKIAYFSALYYIHNVMGKELDQYSKNVAAKIAEMNTVQINAFEMYYKEGDFDDINNFINFLAETFKLKGLTTEVFVSKWAYLFSPSAMYASECFTSFASILVATYVGAYVVNQKQIEKICANSMIKFSTEVLNLGSDLLQNKYRESFDDYMSSGTKVLIETLNRKKNMPDNAKIDKLDYITKKSLLNRTENMIKYYKSINDTKTLSKKLKTHAIGISKVLRNTVNESTTKYQSGTLHDYTKLASKYLIGKDKEKVYHEYAMAFGKFNMGLRMYDKEADKDKVKKYTDAIKEYRESMNLM